MYLGNDTLKTVNKDDNGQKIISHASSMAAKPNVALNNFPIVKPSHGDIRNKGLVVTGISKVFVQIFDVFRMIILFLLFIIQQGSSADSIDSAFNVVNQTKVASIQNISQDSLRGFKLVADSAMQMEFVEYLGVPKKNQNSFEENMPTDENKNVSVMGYGC